MKSTQPDSVRLLAGQLGWQEAYVWFCLSGCTRWTRWTLWLDIWTFASGIVQTLLTELLKSSYSFLRDEALCGMISATGRDPCLKEATCRLQVLHCPAFFMTTCKSLFGDSSWGERMSALFYWWGPTSWLSVQTQEGCTWRYEGERWYLLLQLSREPRAIKSQAHCPHMPRWPLVTFCLRVNFQSFFSVRQAAFLLIFLLYYLSSSLCSLY